MSLERHLEALRRKHQELDDKIDRLSRPPLKTYADLRPAKRERLRLKEAIVAAEAALKRQQEAQALRTVPKASAAIVPMPPQSATDVAYRDAA